MFRRRHTGPDFDADPGKGGGGGTGDPGAGSGDGGTGGNQSGNTPAEGDPGEKLTPDEQIANLTKERDDFKSKHEALSTRIGEQGKQIQTLKNIDAMLKRDPKTLLSNFAKTAGVFVNFEKPTPASGGDGSDGNNADGGNAPAKVSDAELSMKINREVQSYLHPTHEKQMQISYKDWDSLSDERGMLTLDVAAGTLSEGELLHFAARGRNLGAILEAAKKGWEKEFTEDLQKKHQEQIESGGAGGGAKGGGGKTAATSLEEAMKGGLFNP